MTFREKSFVTEDPTLSVHLMVRLAVTPAEAGLILLQDRIPELTPKESPEGAEVCLKIDHV
jgi:hypothetical protein